jgi:hypothetical protein
VDGRPARLCENHKTCRVCDEWDAAPPGLLAPITTIDLLQALKTR